MFVQLVISGLITGTLYALLALGLVLIYKTTDIVNFSQGEMAMITTFTVFMFITGWEIPFWASVLLGLIFAFCLGVLIEKLVINKIRNAPHISIVIVTIGLLMILNGVAGWIWGYQPTTFPTIISGEPLTIGNVNLTMSDLVNLGISIVVIVAFYLIFKFTLTGIAMKAISENISTANIIGIPVNRVIMMTWGFGGVLAGLAGILIAPSSYLEINMMTEILLKAFTAAVIGGMMSLPGAIVGGIVLGILENLVGYYISTELKEMFAFILIVVVLMIRPSGLFGTVQRKKV